MPPATPDSDPLEGRLTAHRTVLARLIAASPEREALLALLRDRSIMHDGQEDPGAVPTEAVRIEGARADEFRLLAEAVARQDQSSSEASSSPLSVR